MKFSGKKVLHLIDNLPCLGNAEAGGFRRQSLRNFLPIPSSLFPKKPSPFHMGSYFGKVPPVNPSVKNQRFLPAPTGREPRAVPAGVPPVSISHGSLLRFVLSLTHPVSLLRCSRCTAQSPPLPKGGASAAPRRGDSSGWQVSTLACTFGKCLL